MGRTDGDLVPFRIAVADAELDDCARACAESDEVRSFFRMVR